jgi:hypothetical protein
VTFGFAGLNMGQPKVRLIPVNNRVPSLAALMPYGGVRAGLPEFEFDEDER